MIVYIESIFNDKIENMKIVNIRLQKTKRKFSVSAESRNLIFLWIARDFYKKKNLFNNE